MGRLVILVLEPRPEATVQRIETAGVAVDERGEDLGATRTNEPLGFVLRLGMVGSRVDERHAELRAHERQAARAIGGAVVDVESGWYRAALDRTGEDRQERGGVFAACEGRLRHTTRVASSSRAIRYVLCHRRSSSSSTVGPCLTSLVRRSLASEATRGTLRPAAAVARARPGAGRLPALGRTGNRPQLRRAPQRAEPDVVPLRASGASGARCCGAAARLRASRRASCRFSASVILYPNQRLAFSTRGGSRMR
jgi:hypothetical protein